MRVVITFLSFLLTAGFAIGFADAATAGEQQENTVPAPQPTDKEQQMSDTDNASQAAIAGHPFRWIEFSSKDSAVSAKFFSDAFGWQVQPFTQMANYFFFMPPKGLMGGIQGNAPADRPQTVPYLYVTDIDEALTQIAEAGGTKLMDKMEVPDTDGGHVAMFKDPAGATIGLTDIPMADDYSPLPFGSDEKPLANTICSLELFGGDFAKTKEFYEGLFTWGTKPMSGNYMAFSPGSGVSGVFQNHTPQIPALAYIWVDDINAAVAKIKAAGGKMDGDVIFAEGMGHFAYFIDPAGVELGLIGK